MRRLLVTVAVLLGLLLVADRAGAAFASRAVADQARVAAALPTTPDVSIGGFPFLTQALGGRYEQVEVTATDVPAGDLTVARLDATLTGVQVPLSRALSGDVDSVPVDGVQAQALLGYAELNRRSGSRQLTVAPAGDRLRVTGSVEVLGRTVTATAVSRVEVVEGDLVVTAESYELPGGADALVTRALGGRLDLRIPVTGLPYGLKVTGVSVRPDGVAVAARAAATVLSPS